MKVLLINGSPRGEKCTYTALKAVGEELVKNGVEYEIFNVGTKPVQGCIGCGGCARRGDGHCVFGDDGVNECIDKMRECDGVVVGSPVHYAAASGAVTSLLDRACYAGGSAFAYKPAAAVVSCRRGGATAAFDQLNKYFSILNMPIISSNYWNMVHGNTPEEVLKDEEGMQTMRNLAKNMAWILAAIDAAKAAGIEKPQAEPKIKTNYIR